MVKLVYELVSRLEPNPAQSRSVPNNVADLTPEQRKDLILLGESLRVKQLQPVVARPDGKLIAGHRRRLAALLVGIEKLLVLVTDEELSETQERIYLLTENVHRADFSPFEKFRSCKGILEINPTWKAKDLADHLKIDPGTVSKILAADKVCNPVLEAFAAGKIGPSDVYAISKAETEAEQLELLAAKLSGATRDQIEKKRGAASRSAPQVKLARVRCPLPTGATVTVAGEEMSLEDLIEALSAALDAARKAVKESLDVKTAQRVWADKAKAGA